MKTAEIYVDENSWNAICELIAARPGLAEALGIFASPITGVPGFDEIIDRLGGEWNVWPEAYRAAFV